MTYVKGIDVSSWQDLNSTPQKINWQKAKAQGVKFVFIRACNGLIPDEDFEYNWQGAKEVGLLRGAYQFYDYRKSPVDQAKYLADLLAKDKGELPPVCDLEYYEPWGAIKRENILNNLGIYFNALKIQEHPQAIFYTNPAMILYTLAPVPPWLASIPLWIAHYGVQQPMLKAVEPWGKWTFWQYSSTGDGLAYGMESRGLDMDWFNGTEQELRKWAGVESSSPPELSLEEKVARLWEAHPELH